jgi:hypothetical protein
MPADLLASNFNPVLLEGSCLLQPQTSPGLHFFVAGLPAFQSIPCIKACSFPPPTGRHFWAVI